MSNMTDAPSLTRLLAERVMGWTKETRIGDLSATDETRYFPHPTDGILIGVAQFAAEIDGERWYYRSWRPWRPLESMDDVMQVVYRLQGDRWDYELGSCVYSDGRGNLEEGHSATFMRGLLDPYDGTHEEHHDAYAPVPARAICLASLAAMGIEVEEPSS